MFRGGTVDGMAVAGSVRAVPTLEDAERAAEACIADPRVRKVAVFGSVARGNADLHSDIDLLVLIDSAWGERTPEMRCSLQVGADEAAGRHCDLMLRTTAFWRHMAENVSASFEASISRDIRELLERGYDENEGEPGDMGDNPMSNNDIAAEALRVVARQLSDTRSTLRDIPELHRELQDLPSEEVEESLNGRFATVLADAHLGIELSIKALGAVCEEKMLPRSHDLGMLLNSLLASPYKTDIAAAVDSLSSGQSGSLLNWRISIYPEVETQWTAHATPENADRHLRALLECSDIVVRAAENHAAGSAQILSAADKISRVAISIKAMGVDASYLMHGVAEQQLSEQEQNRSLLARFFKRKALPERGAEPAGEQR